MKWAENTAFGRAVPDGHSLRCVADRVPPCHRCVRDSSVPMFKFCSLLQYCEVMSSFSGVSSSLFLFFSPPILYEIFDPLSHVQNGTGQAATSDRRSACQHHNNHPNLSLSRATTSPPRGQLLSTAVRLCRLDITQAWASTVSCTVLSQAQANRHG